MKTLCLIHATRDLPADIHARFVLLRKFFSAMPGFILLEDEEVSVTAASALVVLLDHGCEDVWRRMKLRVVTQQPMFLFHPPGKRPNKELQLFLALSRQTLGSFAVGASQIFPDARVYEGSDEIVATLVEHFPETREAFSRPLRIYH